MALLTPGDLHEERFHAVDHARRSETVLRVGARRVSHPAAQRGIFNELRETIGDLTWIFRSDKKTRFAVDDDFRKTAASRRDDRYTPQRGLNRDGGEWIVEPARHHTDVHLSIDRGSIAH